MARRMLCATCLIGAGLIAGCGGGGTSKVASSSLQPRLRVGTSVPGFGLQRELDWNDPVNLVGEGLTLPQRTRPSEAVKEFNDSHLRGARGAILTQGHGLNETEIRIGVARFASASDAIEVRDWMHKQDLEQPCYSQCVFAPSPVAIPGAPTLRFVVQSTRTGPANYLAEFTNGPYLTWFVLHADTRARNRVELGLKLFYVQSQSLPT